MKRIKFLHDWRYSRAGDVIEEGDGVALLLVQRGIAEEVSGEDGEGQTGPPAPPAVRSRRVPGPHESRP